MITVEVLVVGTVILEGTVYFEGRNDLHTINILVLNL